MLRPKRFGVLVAVLFFAWQCGDSGTNVEPSCSTTGTADATLFSQHFERMALVDRATGLPGATDSEFGERYSSSAFLEVRMDARAAVAVRVCVETRDASRVVVKSVTHSATAGSSGAALGTFPVKASGYVVRVTVNDVLVKNFPFATQ